MVYATLLRRPNSVHLEFLFLTGIYCTIGQVVQGDRFVLEYTTGVYLSFQTMYVMLPSHLLFLNVFCITVDYQQRGSVVVKHPLVNTCVPSDFWFYHIQYQIFVFVSNSIFQLISRALILLKHDNVVGILLPSFVRGLLVRRTLFLILHRMYPTRYVIDSYG